jgi:hypothetical protein
MIWLLLAAQMKSFVIKTDLIGGQRPLQQTL